MSHVVIIIERKSVPDNGITEGGNGSGPSYRYEIPIPHGCTPQDVGEIARKAYRRLEGTTED